MARDFLAYSPGGEAVRLSDLRGTPTIVNFWATWCSSCVAELPDLRDLQAELGPERLSVLAVNVGENAGTARKFLDSLDASSLQVGMDPTLVVADAYGVRGMPQSIFIDSEGIIRAVYVGQLAEEALREYLASATTGTDQPNDRLGPLRLVTTVGRERVLEVERLDDAQIEFRSKSLRCDDAYCAGTAVDVIARAHYGTNVILASRLVSEGKGGEIVVSAAFRQLVEHAPGAAFANVREVALKGLSGTHHIQTVAWSRA